jgi:hypothetical protein
MAKPNPESKGYPSSSRINGAFERYRESVYEEIRRDINSLLKEGSITADEGEKLIAKKMAEHNSLDLNGRILAMTNNFPFWFPGGYYRKLSSSETGEEESIYSESEIAYQKKLIADLDRVIKRAGYGDDIMDLIQKRNAEGRNADTRAMVIWDIYSRMINLGYNGERLRI